MLDHSICFLMLQVFMLLARVCEVDTWTWLSEILEGYSIKTSFLAAYGQFFLFFCLVHCLILREPVGSSNISPCYGKKFAL